MNQKIWTLLALSILMFALMIVAALVIQDNPSWYESTPTPAPNNAPAGFQLNYLRDTKATAGLIRYNFS